MDFKHPFISNPRLGIYYFLVWLSIIVIGVLIKWLSFGVDPGLALTEAIAFNLSYAVIGSSIWYVIKFSTLEDNSIRKIVASHAISATVIVFIWSYTGTVIIKLLYPVHFQQHWVSNKVTMTIFGGYMSYITIVIFFYAVNYYQEFKKKLINEGNLKSLVKEAELHALKSQINPHFLFNSLNSISSLTMTDPDKAQEMVINLSSLMRYSLRHEQIDKVPLSEELKNNMLYLHIEKVRFGEKLNPVFEINENCMQAQIPNMILQPLYENAIKYGVYEATETVDVITAGRMVNDVLEITITNNYDSVTLPKRGEGIGLRNIRDRLQIIYGNSMLMKVEDDKKKFKVTLAIPQE